MRLHLVPALCLWSACSPSPAWRPDPIATPCMPDRVGTVTVTGEARAAVPQLVVLEGTLDDPARTERVVQAATEALQWRGHAHAKIELARRAGCFMDLHAKVTLGPRYKIGRIAFDTADDFPQPARLAALEDALGTVNVEGGVLIEYRLRRALAGLAKSYRDAGWLDVAIGEPRAAYAGREVDVTIPITAGERYRVGVIRALGGSARVRARLIEELGIEPGAWYDGPAIRRAFARVRRSLGREVQLRASALDDRAEIELEVIVEARR